MNTSQLLQQVVFQSAVFVLIGIIVYGLTRVLRFHPGEWSFPDAQRSSIWAIASLLIGWTLVAVFFLTFVRGNAQETTAAALQEPRYNLNDVFNQFLIGLIAFGPALLVMRLRKEPWASAGVTHRNLGKTLAIGLILGMFSLAGIFFGEGAFLREVLDKLSASHFWAFLSYSIVGFGEEFGFRGYLQTRLVAWLGRLPGWLIASIIMAMAHIVQRISIVGLQGVDAWISSAALIPISLLMGYVMLRTQNIVAPGLFHTFADWVGTLG